MSKGHGERLVKVETEMKAAISRQNKTDELISKLTDVVSKQSVHIDLLMRCVYGMVTMVLAGVGASILRGVVK